MSRTYGAEGESGARRVADKLGFRYIDNEIILSAAERVGISAGEVAAAEVPKPLLSKILESIGTAGAASPDAVLTGMNLVDLPPATERLIEAIVRETAEDGNVVIVAHAAAIPLAGMRGLLRVEVTASEETRTKRIGAAENLTSGDAEKAIRGSDKARAEYLRRFYKITEERPTLFDLVINTDVLNPEQAAAAVEAAATTPQAGA